MPSIDQLDRRTLAGVVTRAALEVSGIFTPESQSHLPDEAAIRAQLIARARRNLGLAPDDQREESLDQISDFLDRQGDELLGPYDVAGAVARMTARGDLPSDLYDVEIIPNIRQLYGAHFEAEKQLIEWTVHSPEREQHFGAATRPGTPSLISLFAKSFRTAYPFKDFVMLVAGHRGDRTKLHVHQAWRVYPSLLGDVGGGDLVTLLRRFAERYGHEIEIEGQRAKFFLYSERPAPSYFYIRQKSGRSQGVHVTQFRQSDPASGKTHASLVVAIDLDAYSAMLKQMTAEPIITPVSTHDHTGAS